MKWPQAFALSLFFAIFAYFTYIGLTTSVWEQDSLAYHLPIAQRLAQGQLSPWDEGIGLGFYPAIGEIILALFLLLHLPLNLFNLLSWTLLFLVIRYTALTLNLSNSTATIAAVSVCLLNSVLRLLPTQTIDIYLALFYTLSLHLALKPARRTSDFAKLGATFGLLVGTKYSGPLFALPLLAVLIPKSAPKLHLKQIAAFLVPFTLFGLSWYVRNWIITGNPIYPGSLTLGPIHLVGHPQFPFTSGYPALLSSPQAPLLFAQSLVSEYLIWSLPLLFAPLIIWKTKPSPIRLLFALAFVNFFLFLFLHVPSTHFVSNLRFAHPVFIPLILGTFLLAKHTGRTAPVSLISLLSATLTLTQLNYHPKLFFLFLLGLTALLLLSHSPKLIK